MRAFQPSASTKRPPDNAAEIGGLDAGERQKCGHEPCHFEAAASTVGRRLFACTSRDTMDIGFDPVGRLPLEADPRPLEWIRDG